MRLALYRGRHAHAADSGRFTPEQRAVYDLVFAAQQAAMAAVAPGNDFLEPTGAMRVLAEACDLGVLRVSADEAPIRTPFFRRTRCTT